MITRRPRLWGAILLAIVAWGMPPLFAAIAYLGVHASAACTGGNCSVAAPRTAAINTQTASLLVMGVSNSQSLDCSNAPDSDSPDETWSKGTLTSSAAYVATRIDYVVNPTGGAAQTFGCTTGGATMSSVYATAFTGVKTSATPFDVEAGGYSFATSQATGNMTPTENGELLIVTWSTDDTGAQTVSASDGTSMTILDQIAYSAGNYYGGGLAYGLQATAATVSITVSGGNKGRAVRGASFKAAPAATGTSRIMLLGVGAHVATPERARWALWDGLKAVRP